MKKKRIDFERFKKIERMQVRKTYLQERKGISRKEKIIYARRKINMKER